MNIRATGRLKIINLAALLTVLGSALSAVLQIESILLRWQVILLLGAFVGLQLSLPEVSEDPAARRKAGLFASLQALIVAYLVLRTGIGFSFLVLFFILSTNIALYYPLRWVFAWIGGFILLTAFLNVRGGGWELLLLETAVYAAGYLFFGIITGALRTAQLARAQSESLYQQQTYLVARQKELLEGQAALLDELQLKNRQLEDYAQQAQTLAVVEERNRLSREMHDTLGHRLTSSSVQLEAAQRLLPADRERAGLMLGEVRQEIRQALAELRQVVGRLREPVESELDLPQALRRIDPPGVGGAAPGCRQTARAGRERAGPTAGAAAHDRALPIRQRHPGAAGSARSALLALARPEAGAISLRPGRADQRPAPRPGQRSPPAPVLHAGGDLPGGS
jgi:signal transduction histidine kinase